MGHAGFRTPGAFQTPAQAPAAETVPVVVTVKFNGKVLVERKSMHVPPSATFEMVTRARLEAALGVKQAAEYASVPLKVTPWLVCRQWLYGVALTVPGLLQPKGALTVSHTALLQGNCHKPKGCRDRSWGDREQGRDGGRWAD